MRKGSHVAALPHAEDLYALMGSISTTGTVLRVAVELRVLAISTRALKSLAEAGSVV